MSEPIEVSIEHLRKHLAEFQQYLDIDIIAPMLRNAQLLTNVEEWYLTNRELSPEDRITQLLLLVLGRKGKSGASKFIECIRRTSDCHLPHEHLIQLFPGKSSRSKLWCGQNIKTVASFPGLLSPKVSR